MINTCVIGGRLGQDPEIRQTQNGTPCANFSIACERNFKNQQGQHDTDWIRCACFGATADFAGKYLRRGRMVCVVGRLQSRKWTDRNGQEKETTEIIVENIHFADSPQRDSAPAGNGYQGGNAGYSAGSPGGYGGGYQNGNRNQGGYGGGYGGQ